MRAAASSSPSRPRAVGVVALALVTCLGALLPGTAHASGNDAVIDASAADATAWPGPAGAGTADRTGQFGADLSGLSWVAGATPAADRVFAARDDGRLFRLRPAGTRWEPDTSQGWGSGKSVTFPGGATGPDVEAVVVRNQTAWLSVERDGGDRARPSILRVPVTGSDATLQATDEWSLASFYPGMNANLGPEALTLVPNDFLVGKGFVDEATGRRFTPSSYPDQRGAGVFLVAVEAPGFRQRVDAFVLRDGGGVVKVASFDNPVGLATELDFDESTGRVWATCDDFCDVRAAVFEVGSSGRFVAVGHHRRPAGLPNQNFEGFTVAPVTRCVAGTRPVLWVNDANNSGHALWTSRIACPAAGGGTTGTLRVSTVATRAGAPTVLDVAVAPGSSDGAGGTVEVAVGSLRASAPVRDGVARVRVGTFVTSGPRDWTATWTYGTRTARASGRLTVAKALTTLRAPRSVVRTAKGKRARVVVHVAAGATRTSGRIRVKVSAGGRSRFVSAQVKRIARGSGATRSTKVVVRTPRLSARLAKGPVKVVVVYDGSRHTTAVRRAVKVRLR